MIDSIVMNIMLTLEVERYAKKAKRLGYHLPRCIKESDKIKLTAMLTLCVKMIESSLTMMVENLKDTKTLLING